MSETIRVTKEELYDLLDDLDPVETTKWRHGHRNIYVFEKDAKHWVVQVDVHPEEGWQVPDEQNCERVWAHQVVTTSWRGYPPKETPTPSHEHKGEEK